VRTPNGLNEMIHNFPVLPSRDLTCPWVAVGEDDI